MGPGGGSLTAIRQEEAEDALSQHGNAVWQYLPWITSLAGRDRAGERSLPWWMPIDRCYFAGVDSIAC